MMVNFICRLSELRDAQVAGKSLFLAVSVRLFMRENDIKIGRLGTTLPHH